MRGDDDKEGGSHGGHGQHGELGLDGGVFPVGVAVDHPPGIVDLAHALQRIEDLVDEDHEDEHDPVFILDAVPQLGEEGGFPLYRLLLGAQELVPTFLGDPRSRVKKYWMKVRGTATQQRMDMVRR